MQVFLCSTKALLSFQWCIAKDISWALYVYNPQSMLYACTYYTTPCEIHYVYQWELVYFQLSSVVVSRILYMAKKLAVLWTRNAKLTAVVITVSQVMLTRVLSYLEYCFDTCIVVSGGLHWVVLNYMKSWTDLLL